MKSPSQIKNIVLNTQMLMSGEEKCPEKDADRTGKRLSNTFISFPVCMCQWRYKTKAMQHCHCRYGLACSHHLACPSLWLFWSTAATRPQNFKLLETDFRRSYHLLEIPTQFFREIKKINLNFRWKYKMLRRVQTIPNNKRNA